MATTTTTSFRKAISHPDLRDERKVLSRYDLRTSGTLPDSLWGALSAKKTNAVAADDELLAKTIWCLESIGTIQDQFIAAYGMLLSGNYQEGWNTLERCQISIYFLNAHFIENNNRFGIDHIRTHVRRFQELFPFSYGASPAWLTRIARCSVCQARMRLRGDCQHEVGEIYRGEMCVKIVEDAELLHIAIVENPNQKYSVIFPNGNDDPRLYHLKELASMLESPWTCWSYQRESRITTFSDDERFNRNAPCPCGSGSKLKRCSCPKERTSPHFELRYEGKVMFKPFAT